jgi:response regulator RpfG family c-di-GMP phosphodiesterase
MLRYIGCTAGAHVVAEVMGDEIATSSWFATINQGEPSEAMAPLVRNIGSELPPWQRFNALLTAFTGLPGLARMGQAAHCEVATNLTERLGLGTTLRSALPALMERWDGKGQPGRLSGEQIPVSVRLANLAQDSAVWLRVGGVEAAIATARRRASRAHDPALVEGLVEHPAILANLDDGASWELAIESEPEPQMSLGPRQIEVALEAIADFVDLKSPELGGHSRAVARVAEQAGGVLRLSQEDRRDLHQAGLVHDLGRVAITAGIWHKPGKLTEESPQWRTTAPPH